MSRTMQIKRDAKSDMLCAEILAREASGIVQIRAVVPMKRIRAFVDRLVAKRSGRSVSSVSGDSRIQRQCNVIATKLAGRELFSTIMKAGRSPAIEQARKKQQQLAMVAKLVELSESGELDEEFGGWNGVRDAFARKRKARYQAMIVRGVPEASARSLIGRARLEDEIILRAAMVETGAQEDPDQDDADEEAEDQADQEAEEDDEASDQAVADELEDEGTDPEVADPMVSGDRDGRDARVGGGFSLRNPFKRKKKRATAAQRMDAARARSARAQEESDARAAESEAQAAEDVNRETPKDDASEEPIDAANPPPHN